MIRKKIKSYVSRDKDFKEILLKSASAFFIKVGGVLFGVIFTLIVSRRYGADNYGIISICINVTQISALFIMLGMDSALLRYAAEFRTLNRRDVVREIYNKILQIAIPAGLIVTVILYLSAPLLAEYVFNKPHITNYLYLTALLPLPWALSLINASGLRGLKDIKSFSFLRETSRFMLASGLIYLFSSILGLNPYNTIHAFLAATIITSVFGILLWKRSLKKVALSVGESVRKAGYKEIFNVAIPLLLVSSINQLSQIINSLMLGMYAPEDQVGIFNVAIKVANFISVPLVAINSISAPKFSEFFIKNDLKSIERMSLRSTKLIFWSSMPFFILCVVNPDFIMQVFGSDFVGSGIVLTIIVVGQLVNASSGSVGVIMQMTGRQVAFRNIIMSSTFITILLNLYFIPTYGVIGVALTTALHTIMWNLASVWYIKKHMNIFTLYFPFKKINRK
ncbi:MAG TPA: flippase [Bacteroidia bacterium]|nr:flippase [Bacteroidia bacterium]HNT80735.1 flippase [Bacteroidia bacterium]